MPQSLKFLYLNQEDVIACGGLDMKQTLASVESAFELLDAGECIEPHSAGLRWSDAPRVGISNHPAYVGGEVQIAGVKWQGTNPENPGKRNQPNASALIILNDAESALPLAVMDGTLISAMRTGAVVGLGARYLARPDAEVVALIGAGVINRAQVTAICHTMPRIRLVRLFSLTRDKAIAFAAEMAEQLQVEFQVVDSSREAVEGADIVAPATHVGRNDGYIKPEWIKEGTYLGNLSGNDYASDVFLSCDRILVDNKKQLQVPHLALSRLVKAGRVEAEAINEFGGVVTGRLPGRVHQDERIIFCPFGMGIEDVISARRVYTEALQRGIGHELTLWQKPHWT